MINKLKNNKVINNETYEILKYDLGNVFSKILQNNYKNKQKQQGRRYSEDIKRFALTLHYHSPKAYEYCRFLTFSLFFSSIQLLKTPLCIKKFTICYLKVMV